MPLNTKWRDHLVIPDPHATPLWDNQRFTALGNYIMERQPSVIVCLGDFGCCPSLSSYDKGKKSFEGRRFKEDCAAIIDAQEKMFGPMMQYNERQRRFKERQYRPEIYLLGGNHDEGRVNRVVNDNPELAGFVDLSEFKYDRYWTYIPYKVSIEIDGISYCHHFPSGPMGRPIGGVNLGRSLLLKNHQSSTVGHDHRWSEATETRANGSKMWGLSAGCFFDFTPDYAIETAKDWWRGIVVKEEVRDGDYDLTRVSLERLMEKFL